MTLMGAHVDRMMKIIQQEIKTHKSFLPFLTSYQTGIELDDLVSTGSSLLSPLMISREY